MTKGRGKNWWEKIMGTLPDKAGKATTPPGQAPAPRYAPKRVEGALPRRPRKGGRS